MNGEATRLWADAVEMIRPHYAGEILIGDIGPVVGSHTGRGTIGLAFQVTK